MNQSYLHELCARRGVKIVPRGQAYHLIGPGVDILVCGLWALSHADLMPF